MRLRLILLVLTTTLIASCGPVPAPNSPKGEPLNGQSLTRIDTGAQPASAPVASPLAFSPDDAAAYAFARAFLDGLQPRSIAARAEYCGYFFVGPDGQIAATPPRRGSFAACDMPAPRPGDAVFASYHTHSAFDPRYDNEVPSVTDLLSDFEFAIDGYVSTPGGRVWHVDFGSQSTEQICGLRCVYQDPGFRPLGESGIRARYTLPQLRQR